MVEFLVGDFVCAWNAVADRRDLPSRGNFMFANQACVLLEVACRLCKSDRSGAALADFGRELMAGDRRYFTSLPRKCSSTRYFDLPSPGGNRGGQLLDVIFDLVRNGQAHQYQQIRATLDGGNDLCIELTGASFGATLPLSLEVRPKDHLKLSKDASNDLWLRVRPDVLFLDIRHSINAARLLSRGLSIAGRLKRTFRVHASDLERVLQAGGH